jgi:hypothetical protein
MEDALSDREEEKRLHILLKYSGTRLLREYILI